MISVERDSLTTLVWLLGALILLFVGLFLVYGDFEDGIHEAPMRAEVNVTQNETSISYPWGYDLQAGGELTPSDLSA